MGPWPIIGIVVIVVVLVLSVLGFIVSRTKKCPSDKILVVYGRVTANQDGSKRSADCVHGGVKFIIPFIQAYQFMDLTPMSISVDLKSALSKQNIRIDVPSVFTVGISTENGVMQNAAERLLGLRMNEIETLAKDIIFGQLRLVIATMEIEEINTDRDKFLEAVARNVELELKKIGLRLINVNVVDIKDESGYIDALGKEAAAKAINEAKKSVAEKNRDGAIGEANAYMDQRIKVAEANQVAISGENVSLGKVAQSDAARREEQAEAKRKAETAEKIATAKVLEDSYRAEEIAERARFDREKATLEANDIVSAEIEKQKRIIEADAVAETARREAKGHADAIYAKLEAEAKGSFEILSKQAEGFARLIKSAGDPQSAVQLLITDKLEKLVEIQVEAIKNLKIDKVTVWDSGNKDGSSSTANFAQSLLKSLPPLQDLYKSAGLNLPPFLVGKEEKPIEPVVEVEVKEEKKTKK
ncbi:MAG: hypothetical protein LBM99_00760 [Bacillales bacterium]|jgi:flotillin|nr:hypothetical protein [Bacillales bacterium]